MGDRDDMDSAAFLDALLEEERQARRAGAPRCRRG